MKNITISDFGLSNRTRQQVVDFLEKKVTNKRYETEHDANLVKALLWAYKEKALDNDKVIVSYPYASNIFVIKVYCECCGKCELVPVDKEILKSYIQSPLPYVYNKAIILYYNLSHVIGHEYSPLADLHSIFTSRLCENCIHRSVNDVYAAPKDSIAIGDKVKVCDHKVPVFGSGAWGKFSEDSNIDTCGRFSLTAYDFRNKILTVDSVQASAEIGAKKDAILTGELIRCSFIRHYDSFDRTITVTLPISYLEQFKPTQFGKYRPVDLEDAYAHFDIELRQNSLDGADREYKLKEIIRIPYTPELKQEAYEECATFIARKYIHLKYTDFKDKAIFKEVFPVLAFGENTGFTHAALAFDEPTDIRECTKNHHLYAAARFDVVSNIIHTTDELYELGIYNTKKWTPAYFDKENSVFHSNGNVMFVPKPGDIVTIIKNNITNGLGLSYSSLSKITKVKVENVYAHAFIDDTQGDFERMNCFDVDSDDFSIDKIQVKCHYTNIHNTKSKYSMSRVNFPHFTYTLVDGDNSVEPENNWATFDSIIRATRRNKNYMSDIKTVDDGYIVSKEDGREIKFSNLGDAHQYIKNINKAHDLDFNKTDYISDICTVITE